MRRSKKAVRYVEAHVVDRAVVALRGHPLAERIFCRNGAPWIHWGVDVPLHPCSLWTILRKVLGSSWLLTQPTRGICLALAERASEWARPEEVS